MRRWRRPCARTVPRPRHLSGALGSRQQSLRPDAGGCGSPAVHRAPGCPGSEECARVRLCPARLTLLRGFDVRPHPDPHRLLTCGVMGVGQDSLFLRGEVLAEGLLEQDLFDPLPDLLFGHRESIASRLRTRKSLPAAHVRSVAVVLYSVKGWG